MAGARFTDLDIGKGLAIFLVVLGHVVAREPPAGNEWYVQLKLLVYKFHMPFFMFLSGAIFEIACPQLDGIAAYGRYVRKRAARLVPGFVLFSLLIWSGKFVAGSFLYVDNRQPADIGSLLQIYLRPAASVAGSLWYLYVLFAFHLAFPLIVKLCRRKVYAILALTSALHVAALTLDLSNRFAIDRFCEYALYFSLGIAFIRHYEVVVAFVLGRALLFYGLFSLSFLTIPIWPGAVSKTVIGICALPALYAFGCSFRSGRDRSVLLGLGKYTLTIYLMNTIFIGATKGALLRFLPWDHQNFLLYFPVLLGIGLIGPVLLHRNVLERMGYLGRITR
jgi:fucose 4-O-acetylase-like acetyltransferase